MADQEIRRQILGIDLGGQGDPRDPVVEALRQRGFDVNAKIVSHLRGGFKSGNEMINRLLCAELLETNDASKKDHYYLQIATRGLNRVSSVGFTEALAQGFGIRPQALTRLLRAMRVELVYSEMQGYDSQITYQFRNMAMSFFVESTTSRDKKARQLLSAKEEWDRRSIRSFYRAFYGVASSSTIGLLPPYEVEVFETFYQHQAERAFTLTPFDRLVLTEYAQRLPEEPFITRVRDETGIKFDKAVLYDHRNLLLEGPKTQGESR